MPNNHFVKSKKAREIRELAQGVGVENHDSPLSQELLDHHTAKSELKKDKSRTHKKLKKLGNSPEEIAEELLKIEEDYHIPEFPADFPYMFNEFKVRVIVHPPTRRRLDPANLYPTVKPIIDALTDCGWWIDDNYEYLKEVSFSYGGVSGEKGVFRLDLVIEEIFS